jgi:hypothetical protein
MAAGPRPLHEWESEESDDSREKWEMKRNVVVQKIQRGKMVH